MSWVVLRRVGRRGTVSKPAVTLSVSKPGRLVQRIYLTVTPSRLDGALAWWDHKQAVEVAVGEGEHAGRIMLAARQGGEFRVMGPTGRPAAGARMSARSLQIDGVAGMPEGGLARRAVAWEIVGEALVVTLPWSGVTSAVKTGPPSAPPVREVFPKPVLTDNFQPISERPSVAAPRQPVVAKYAEIERWAIGNGIGSPTHGFDLAKVNQHRLKLGERPFLIQKTAARA